MKKWFKISLLIIVILIKTSAIAQEVHPVMETKEDLMKTGGHIYIVLAVVLTILAGLIIYLIRLDKKIGKLEKSNY